MTVPKDHGKYVSADSTDVAVAQARETALIETQIGALQKAIPSAKIVRIAHANHYVFLSNEAEVLERMTAFINSLPQ